MRRPEDRTHQVRIRRTAEVFDSKFRFWFHAILPEKNDSGIQNFQRFGTQCQDEDCDADLLRSFSSAPTLGLHRPTDVDESGRRRGGQSCSAPACAALGQSNGGCWREIPEIFMGSLDSIICRSDEPNPLCSIRERVLPTACPLQMERTKKGRTINSPLYRQAKQQMVVSCLH